MTYSVKFKKAGRIFQESFGTKRAASAWKKLIKKQGWEVLK